MFERLVFRFLILVAVCNSAFGEEKINMGRNITIAMAPYMARISIKISTFVGYACDGSILSDLYILTAGHCKHNENVKCHLTFDCTKTSFI